MRYMLLYYGQMGESEAEREVGMREMADWYGQLGAALVDGGNPFVQARTVGKEQVREGVIGDMPTGYTIVEAADMEAATTLAKGCPIIKARDVVVLELLPVM